MKLLIVCSALNLDLPHSATPAWWQLFKALYEEGCEIIVIPYRGDAIRSLWWRTYPNPCKLEGEMYFGLHKFSKKLPLIGKASKDKRQILVPVIAQKLVRPKWEKLLCNIIEKEKTIDAVVFLTVPPNQLEGLPKTIKRLGTPVIYYDGDMPAALPRYGGFMFNSYVGVDLSEYDAVIVNSEGVTSELFEMGAKKVYTLHYGADPAVYFPMCLKKDKDIFFCGNGSKFRDSWIECMIKKPSVKLDANFLVSGSGFDGRLGRARAIPMVPFSTWLRYCCSSKINLNIARESHTSVYGTSSSRPFELAALGCCIVSNPYPSLEQWFQIGKELIIVNNEDEAIEVYKWLLNDEETRMKMGEAARERVLKEHTFKHRAKQLLEILNTVNR